MTRVLRAGHDDLGPAVEALRRGGLVAFPTETVYGLGARADDPVALEAIFRAKGRPHDNPLIVHVASTDAARAVLATWPDSAERLARAFWPGALTLVGARRPEFPAAVSAGLDTIAVRVPDHPVARALLEGAGPVAAPSANRSGRPSPTTATHVLDDLGDRVDVVIDGGACRVGLESTVVDVTVDPPLVLRPGAVPVEALRAVLGAVDLHPTVAVPSETTDARAPGMKYRHYSPRAPLSLIEGDPDAVRLHLTALAAENPTVGIVGLQLGATGDRVVSFADLEAFAHDFYAALRALDARGVSRIVVGTVADEGLGRAILNRLRKAATRVERV